MLLVEIFLLKIGNLINALILSIRCPIKNYLKSQKMLISTYLYLNAVLFKNRDLSFGKEIKKSSDLMIPLHCKIIMTQKEKVIMQ